MKRLWIVLVPLLVAPLIALSLLTWWLAGRVYDELITTQRRRHTVLLAEFERHFSDQFQHTSQRIAEWGEELLAGRQKPPPIEEAGWYVVCDLSGRWYYPSAYASFRDHAFAPTVENTLSIDELAQALSYERSQATITFAAEKYEAILEKDTTSPITKARALFGLARCMQKSAKIEQAAQSYRKIIQQYPNLRDETGASIAAEASAALMRLELGQPDRALEAWRQHVDALIEGRYAMPAALAIGQLTEVLATIPQGADSDEADVTRRTRIRAQIDKVNEMNNAVLMVMNQSPSEDPRMEQRGERVLFMQALMGHNPPCWVLASFSQSWVLQNWLSPIVQKLALQESGLLGIRDSQGKIVFGTSMGPEALSAELSLSRWGLPWTFEVGFNDLAQLKAQSQQRHLLLTGSIAVLILLITLGSLIGLHMVRREVELSKLKSDFVDNVSHELRTPVTSIKMFSEMLQAGQTTDPARQQEYFRLLASESGRLARMIDNILNFSRIMAGRIHLNRQRVDISLFLEEQQQQLEWQARTSGHRIHVHLGSDLPVCSIDPDAISRALANLVSNATKYSPREQPIVITAKRRGDMLSLMVRDRGMGIPEKELPRVFDRFYRASNPSGDHVQGTGLGLTIVKDTVERHGGSVHIESRVGEGTMVEMLIPIV